MSKELNKKEIKKIEGIVHDWEFFQSFSKEELSGAIHQFSLRQIAQGEIIFEENEPGDYLILILDGKVEISLHSYSNNKIIAMLEEGAIAGEMSMLDDYPRSATARAIENTEILILTNNKLQHVLVENPPLGVKFLAQLGRTVSLRLRSMVGNLAEIS